MLAGLAAQTLTTGPVTTFSGFATTAVVFSLLLLGGSIVTFSLQAETLRPVRMTGPAVRRWGGWVLVTVGLWFLVLALVSSPIFTT